MNQQLLVMMFLMVWNSGTLDWVVNNMNYQRYRNFTHPGPTRCSLQRNGWPSTNNNWEICRPDNIYAWIGHNPFWTIQLSPTRLKKSHCSSKPWCWLPTAQWLLAKPATSGSAPGSLLPQRAGACTAARLAPQTLPAPKFNILTFYAATGWRSKHQVSDPAAGRPSCWVLHVSMWWQETWTGQDLCWESKSSDSARRAPESSVHQQRALLPGALLIKPQNNTCVYLRVNNCNWTLALLATFL